MVPMEDLGSRRTPERPPTAPPGERARWPLPALVGSLIVAVAASLTRARAGTHDLWYDDSWVALSTRAPLSRAIHMGVSAPGFTILMRWWIGLFPHSIPWAQTFALLPLLLVPFVIFAAARTAGAPRWSATIVACASALTPLLLTESARVKQYTSEYVLSAVMVTIAAAVRRDGPTTRWTVLAACVTVVAVVFAGSMLIPSALLFIVMAVALLAEARAGDGALDLRTTWPRLAILAGAGVIVLAWAQAYLLHPSGALARYWRVRDGFLGSSGSLSHTARQALALVRGFWAGFVFGGGTVLVIIPVVALAWFAWRRWRTSWWLLLAPVAAVALSAARRYPMGTIGKARIEAWLMPWIAVLVALTLAELARVLGTRPAVERVSITTRRVTVGVLALLLAAAALVGTTGYVPTRARRAAAAIAAARRTGRPAFITQNDYPVELLFPGPLRIVTDRRTAQGFSVVLSGQPRGLPNHDARRAAISLRSACGQTATIVGLPRSMFQRVLRQVGCPVVSQRFTRNGTAQPYDDVGTVVLGARA